MKRKRAHIYREQHGFTLIEVLIAMAILTIGILAIVGIQWVIVNGNTNANVVTQQMNLAQRTLERYKNSPTPANLPVHTLTANVDEVGQAGGPYNVEVWVKNPLGGNISRAIEVLVTRNGGVGGHPIRLQCVTQGNGI